MTSLSEREKILLHGVYKLTAEKGEEERILYGSVILDVYYENSFVCDHELNIHIDTVGCKGFSRYRHVLFYKMYSYPVLINRLEKIIQDCQKQGVNMFDYIEEYFIIPPGGYVIYNPARQDHWGVAKHNPQPTCTWRFLDVETIDSQSTDFDEKIEVTVSWLDNRVRQEFKGYWYVTSHGFIDRHTAQHDPYYRRCILVCDTFNPEYVNQQLDLMMRYLATRSMEARIDCLKYHFEYDGQLMFYER